MEGSEAMSDTAKEVEVIPSAISKNSKQREELLKLARKSLYRLKLDPRNFSIKSLPGGKVVFRFGDEEAALAFRMRLPESLMP